MRNYLLLFLGMVLLDGCKSKAIDSGFINHNKWETGDVYTPAKLKANPKEIKESFFAMLTDTIFSSDLTGKFNNYNIYKFDREGNLIFFRFFIDSSFISDAYYSFDENGEHYRFLSYGRGDTSRKERISRKVGKGKYESDKFSNGELEYTDVTTISDKGKIIEIVRKKNDTVSTKKISYYEGDKLIKSIESYNGLVKEGFYYYSKFGFLDSIVMKESDITSKELYINNEHGDPVYFEKNSSSGNIEKKWMKYEYDSKGNWVKQIIKTEGDNVIKYGETTGSEKYPGYTLLLREIKY